MKGLFITIEGSDGSGKSTQIELLKSYLQTKEYDFIFTREPGGTVISEAVRDIILNKDYMEMSDVTESLLYAAARAQHVNELIIPSLEDGKLIICDRFVDSSIAYQGYARELDIESIEMVNNYATRGIQPDLTILLDIDVENALKRKKKQKELDRMELEKLDFHKKVSDGFKELAITNSNRIKLIDANRTIDEVHKEIIQLIEKKIIEQ